MHLSVSGVTPQSASVLERSSRERLKRPEQHLDCGSEEAEHDVVVADVQVVALGALEARRHIGAVAVEDGTCCGRQGCCLLWGGGRFRGHLGHRACFHTGRGWAGGEDGRGRVQRTTAGFLVVLAC